MISALKDNVLHSPLAMNVAQIGQFYISTQLLQFLHNLVGEKVPDVLGYMWRTRTKTLSIRSTDSTYTTMLSSVDGTSMGDDLDGEPAYMEPGDGTELPNNKAVNAQAYFNPATGVNYNFTFEKCTVTIIREGDKDMSKSSGGKSVYRVAISPATPGVMERWIEATREMYQSQKDDRVEIYIAGQSNYYWDFLLLGDRRDLDTIHLAAGVKENIVGMASKFLRRRSDYHSRQINHHLGFCLYGPPGTGKTTLIRAIAYHFKLKIHLLSLSSRDLNDSRLHSLMASTKEGGIILIEDIDKQLNSSSSEITAAGLLQALEGSANTAAQIVFVTANSLEPLKPYEDTVFRHGRIDKKIRLGYADKTMAKSLFCSFFSSCKSETADDIEALSEQFSSVLLEDTWSMAHLEGYLLQYDDDIRKAVSEFAGWQEEQKKERTS
ncbi:hypothetical protein AGABI1DRAFT_108111 [Agaricus bisporus var. burnettii JB137-S8]|uniref:AAA+ ATPase domain-containing protein n=1 Tax=Agaricus bisporus var. burnettii (strain JB137-S8 / ATCC MYA-4627 / FGSC 10392) TaxID=597362 RepID=K5X401_AGABU|nr:uncharacterized protein AGABI1DRAFT_108111 [Agaricus bisporus var. burnettii JB137-S8]EKM77627.1 hypothetical protein AGABI1DRAFT_108111 [Agaricus bisporus var. burnettii JB137-S8]